MAEIAFTILGPVVEEAVSKTVSFLKKRIGIAVDLQKELDRLGDSLILLQSVIQHAEERQESDPAVRHWLQKLKDTAYEAMHALGECEYKILKNKVRSRRHWNPESVYFSPLFRNRMADKINNITKQLNDLKDWASMINLVVSLRGQTCPRQHQKTDSFLDDSTVFEREADVSRILSLLRDMRRSQHPISGISVYMKAKEEKLYDLAAWVCVSEDFNDQIILGEMSEHFGCSAAARNSLNALLEDLAKKVENKTFLLILDDVWNEYPDKGEHFSSCLLKILKTTGSSIVITTRSGKVASAMESVPMQTYDMERLSDDVCWLIIEEKFLRSSTGTSMTPDLEAIGRDIAKKCGGLPLVASVIGGTLSRQTSADEWKDIRDDRAWNLNSRDGDKILSILKISFNHLTSPLKKCFSYCSIFPKDFVIEEDDLVQLWMAQGFLYQANESSVTMEDVGNDYFSQLLSNSLFQDVPMDEYGGFAHVVRVVPRVEYGCTRYCKMHDAVHDLALSVSEGDTFVLEAGCIIDQDAKIRHLRVKHDKNQRPIIPRGVAQRLHSLFLDEVDVFISSASDLKRLRALKIVGAEGEQLPIILGKLKHLKYLDISRSKIKTLPKSFNKLYKLQTFRIKRCYFPQMFDEMRNLISLRHFVFSDEEQMPRDIGHLTSLQTLSFFTVSRANLDQLECLSQLGGSLAIRHLEFARAMSSDAVKANLDKKTKLYELELEWRHQEGHSNNNYEVLEGPRPPSNLKSLIILGYKREKFPSWLEMGANFFGNSSALNNLLTLWLISCNECVEILSLGFIPKLEDLEIRGMPKVKRMGSKFCPERSNMTSSSCGDKKSIILFPALKNLSIWDMEILEEWAEIEGTTIFPCLERLHVRNCAKLKTWSMSGFSSHHKLSEARIIGCPNLVTLPSMERLLSLGSLRLSNLGSIPSGLGSCSSLKYLWLERCCTSSLSMMETISLEILSISECEGLDCLSMNEMISLQTLEICQCKELVGLSGLESCISLKNLDIVNCDNLISISEDVGRLSSLSFLKITRCENLSIPEGWLGRNTRLQELAIGPFWSELEEYPGLTSIHKLHASLKSLTLDGWDKLKSLPHQLQHLTALKSLLLYNFNSLEALPEWLGDLSSLRKLKIGICSSLTHLPSIEAMRRLSNLQFLQIWDCPKLEERCAEESGPEWAKISHIANIEIL